MDSHQYNASLRVQCETVALPELIAELGQPTSSHEAGDPVSLRNPDGPKHAHTHWLFETDPDGSQPFEEQLEAVVEFAERHHDALTRLRRRCERVDISCAIISEESAQGGFDLESRLLKRLAYLELDVRFDVY